jgi:pyruvate kinase
MNIARFNFSHGTHDSHSAVLQTLGQVIDKQRLQSTMCATMLDTKGAEIRTAMLRGGKNILLEAGQVIVIEAVGDRYTEFEGYKDESGTCIGLSYPKLCQSVKPGNIILLADGYVACIPSGRV